MFAIRQMIDDPQDFIAVPSELRHRPTEVIFIALDSAPEFATVAPDQPSLAALAGRGQGERLECAAHGESETSHADCIDAFRGKGKGGTVTRLLQDRHSDREQKA
jgi:hypothetical protein